MKIKCGVIKPHPTDPNKSNIETLESGNLKFVPNFVLKGLMKKMGLKRFKTWWKSTRSHQSTSKICEEDSWVKIGDQANV